MWRWDPDPFGNQPANQNPSAQGTFEYNLRFAGQIFDGVAGLHHNWHRDYSPAIGRYLQSDPIGLGDGTNTYAYVRSMPTMSSDPTGLFMFPWQDPVVVKGGTRTQRDEVRGALDRALKTKRGREIEMAIRGPWWMPRNSKVVNLECTGEVGAEWWGADCPSGPCCA